MNVNRPLSSTVDSVVKHISLLIFIYLQPVPVCCWGLLGADKTMAANVPMMYQWSEQIIDEEGSLSVVIQHVISMLFINVGLTKILADTLWRSATLSKPIADVLHKSIQ